MTERRQTAVVVFLGVIAVLATVAGLYFGRLFLVPIAVAVALNALFRPVVRRLQRWRVPAPAGAALVVLGVLALLAGAGYGLSVPIRAWVAEVPQQFALAQQRLKRFRQPVRAVHEAVQTVQRATQAVSATGPAPASQPATAPAGGGSGGGGVGGEGGLASANGPEGSPPAPAQPTGLASRFIGTTATLVEGATEVLLLLLLILAGGGAFLRKLTAVLPDPPARRTAEEIVHEAEAVVRRYLGVSALINLGQAAVVGLILWWIGMPTPVLWAVFCFALEFVPYLGATVMLGLLSVVALTTFDSPARILLAPGSYLLITTLQNNLVSPVAYGRRLKLNPVAVLIGVVFWWFVWGVPGAFLAVPIVATVKVVADRVEALRPIGVFLGE